MNGGFPLNRKETFSASMVIFIGFFYLLSLASAFIQTRNLHVTIHIGITEIKFLFLGIFYWYGAISFFRVITRGWIICTATLLNFIVVVFQLVASVLHSSGSYNYTAIFISSFMLVLAAFLFLFNKDTRTKFAVTNKSYLLVICVYGLLLALTFLI